MENDQVSRAVNSIVPVPYVNPVGSVFLGIVNIFLPGLGLALASCLQPGEFNTFYIMLAICQFLMLFIVIGWIWAVVNGIFMIFMPFSKEWQEGKKKYDEKLKGKQEEVVNGGEIVQAQA